MAGGSCPARVGVCGFPRFVCASGELISASGACASGTAMQANSLGGSAGQARKADTRTPLHIDGARAEAVVRPYWSSKGHDGWRVLCSGYGRVTRIRAAGSAMGCVLVRRPPVGVARVEGSGHVEWLTRVVERAQDLDLLLGLLALGRAEGLHRDLLQAVIARVAHLHMWAGSAGEVSPPQPDSFGQ